MPTQLQTNNEAHGGKVRLTVPSTVHASGHNNASQANTGILCYVRPLSGTRQAEVVFPKPNGNGTYGIPLYRFGLGEFTAPGGQVLREGTTFNISEELRRTWMRQLGV